MVYVVTHILIINGTEMEQTTYLTKKTNGGKDLFTYYTERFKKTIIPNRTITRRNFIDNEGKDNIEITHSFKIPSGYEFPLGDFCIG